MDFARRISIRLKVVKEAKHRSPGITGRDIPLERWKKGPWLVRDYTTQLCMDYNKPLLRIPIKQPVFHGMSQVVLFQLADCRGDFWRSVRVKHWYSEWILEVSIAAGWFVRWFFSRFRRKKTCGMEKGTVFDPATLPELHVNMHTTQDGLDFRSLQGNVSQLPARPHNSVVWVPSGKATGPGEVVGNLALGVLTKVVTLGGKKQIHVWVVFGSSLWLALYIYII